MSDLEKYRVENVDEVSSPALLVYPEYVEANIQEMIKTTGDAARLRPHVKTHKLAEIIRMQLDHGINRFKCATLAEMEMVAGAGAGDVLLAYQPVGPNIARLRALADKFPDVRVAAVADDLEVVADLSRAFEGAGRSLDLYLDLDCGMHRTGIEPGAGAREVYQAFVDLPNVQAAGLHAYDGHIHDPSMDVRRARWEADFEPILKFRAELELTELPVPGLVASGSPTFPLHAECDDRECSPGTTVLWDFGYGDNFEGLDYQWAALLLTRVISKPGPGRLCLDLGHKAVAPDKPQPRAKLLGLPDANLVMHSEEHLTIETAAADDYKVGDSLYAVPAHICPTVALHEEVVVVREGRAVERWKVEARRRRLTV
jgi:D-serine deaminase-like pyridoxal phosphate-dependent protein